MVLYLEVVYPPPSAKKALRSHSCQPEHTDRIRISLMHLQTSLVGVKLAANLTVAVSMMF